MPEMSGIASRTMTDEIMRRRFPNRGASLRGCAVRPCAHAQLAAEAFGIGAEGGERGPHALEQKGVDHLGMALHSGVEVMGKSGDQVMIGDR